MTAADRERRRLDRLLHLELVTMRCEFARPLAGYAVHATFWGRVPPAGPQATGYPVVDLRDRSVVLRLNKLLGHVLDPDGRRVRSVVPDVRSWTAETKVPVTSRSR